jgi:hypothetical protein
LDGVARPFFAYSPDLHSQARTQEELFDAVAKALNMVTADDARASLYLADMKNLKVKMF